jgi:hypothetical protein
MLLKVIQIFSRFDPNITARTIVLLFSEDYDENV